MAERTKVKIKEIKKLKNKILLLQMCMIIVFLIFGIFIVWNIELTKTDTKLINDLNGGYQDNILGLVEENLLNILDYNGYEEECIESKTKEMAKLTAYYYGEELWSLTKTIELEELPKVEFPMYYHTDSVYTDSIINEVVAELVNVTGNCTKWGLVKNE